MPWRVRGTAVISANRSVGVPFCLIPPRHPAVCRQPRAPWRSSTQFSAPKVENRGSSSIFGPEDRRWGALRSSNPKIEDAAVFDLRLRATKVRGPSIFGFEDRRWGVLRFSASKIEDGGSSIFEDEYLIVPRSTNKRNPM